MWLGSSSALRTRCQRTADKTMPTRVTAHATATRAMDPERRMASNPLLRPCRRDPSTASMTTLSTTRTTGQLAFNRRKRASSLPG